MSSVIVMRAWPRMRLTWAYVEPNVDDQVAREGVAQIVEAKRRPAVVVSPASCAACPRARGLTLRWPCSAR
jgi:hypothetical protein